MRYSEQGLRVCVSEWRDHSWLSKVNGGIAAATHFPHTYDFFQVVPSERFGLRVTLGQILAIGFSKLKRQGLASTATSHINSHNVGVDDHCTLKVVVLVHVESSFQLPNFRSR